MSKVYGKKKPNFSDLKLSNIIVNNDITKDIY